MESQGMMKTSAEGAALIKEFEGFRARAYLCPAGVPTIGYGTTKGVTHEDVRNGRAVSRDLAESYLRRDLAQFEAGVLRLCARTPTQPQFDAMVSLAYNIWLGGFERSTVLRAHNAGDTMAAARAFSLWNKARVGGTLQALPGLTRRRAAEAALYLTQAAADDAPDVAPDAMPQAVEPERTMMASQINRASAVAGLTASVAAANEVMEVVNKAKAQADGLGDWLVPLLLLVAVAGAGWAIYERVRQRQQGWA